MRFLSESVHACECETTRVFELIREGKHEKGIRKRALRFEKLGGLSEQERSARAAKGREPETAGLRERTERGRARREGLSYLTREHYNETCQALVKGPLVLFALSFVFKKKKQEKQEKNKKKTRKNKKEENENDRKPKKFEKHAKDNSVSL